jgi:hypothetical protein
MNGPWEDIAAAGEWLLKLEDEVRLDVVHPNGFCHGYRAPYSRAVRDSAAFHSKGASCA